MPTHRASQIRAPQIRSSPLDGFHPAVAGWFARSFSAPTPAQVLAWPAIASGRHVLICAPTGSGKTLTAFLAGIDQLIRDGLAGRLQDLTRIVYVSPLKALSNDIRTNLELPLQGIAQELTHLGLPPVDIRTAVRTGDTPQSERAALRKRPPHILVTTPESLYVLLGSESGRAMLAPARVMIVDEIHAIAGDKRGSHLCLSMERLEALCARPLTRIGISATQKPLQEMARFLVGAGNLVARADGCAATPWRQTDAAHLEAPSAQQQRAVGQHVLDQHDLGQHDLDQHDLDQHVLDQYALDQHAKTIDAAGTGFEPIADCEIIELGYTRERDLALALPATPLSVVMSNDQWDQVYAKIAELTTTHRAILVFVNTRRMAERAARHLGDLLGKQRVAAHHGSLSKELRLDAERRLKAGELCLIVATASLELGIDIGTIDLVCQLGSPRGIAAFLQRAGRAGHQVGGVPKARLFPTSRDDLVECAALLDCVRRGELDTLRIPTAPLDVLAQQIVAEVSCRQWQEDALYDWFRRAWPYRDLARQDFDDVVRMIAAGYAGRRRAGSALVHRDGVNRKLHGRQGGRLAAIMSGGTIPDVGDYTVLMEPEAITIGSVNEDFAIESLAGDIFQLGNTSYRILRVEPGRLRVEDAQGAPPNLPFWIGEAPGRTDELSLGVSRLREEIASRLPIGPAVQTQEGGPHDTTLHWLTQELSITQEAATQLRDYLLASRVSLGTLPSQGRVVLERFFDESGATQLVIHAPFGRRINRAWGLALRKRFCRKFNFELQAAATEDAIVLSLSTSHSFALIEVVQYLHSNTALEILVQALLDAPLFGVRWRWNASTALALPRYVGGKKVPPQLQRMKSEDLLASVFPDQVACLENIVGERQVPDHPLIAQTLHDCLYHAMDAAGWLQVLRAMESGAIEVIARDLTAPSPLAMEAINARPYAFLDDAPLEERRTQAVHLRRYTDPAMAEDLSRLDPAAIDAVREQVWPSPRDRNEMHEALQSLGVITSEEVQANAQWSDWLRRLAQDHRATCVMLTHTNARMSDSAASDAIHAHAINKQVIDAHAVHEHADVQPCARQQFALWTCAERLAQLRLLFPDAQLSPPIQVPNNCVDPDQTRASALVELVRARLGGLGPVTVSTLALALPVPHDELHSALLQLQTEGVAMCGHFSGTDSTGEEEWCERHLLARIHRYTLARLRREIEPVEPRDFVRFLSEWQNISAACRVNGPDALAEVLAQLEGYEAPVAAWESELLPARVADYSIAWLDEQCSTGRTVWARLRAAGGEIDSKSASMSVRATPIVLLPRRHIALWARLAVDRTGTAQPSSRAREVLAYLTAHGASFFDDLIDGAGLLRSELEDALSELVARGRLRCDSYSGLRALLVPASKRGSSRGGGRRSRRRGQLHGGLQDAGRWSIVDEAVTAQVSAQQTIEHIAHVLLRRYGVVCWRLLEREAGWLPPWRELVRVLQRLEARGEIRGGRFIAGLSGEQFALPEAVAALRTVRLRPYDGQFLRISACDPLNLAGTLLPGDKVPRIAGARLLLRDGLVAATRVAGEVRIVDTTLSAAEQDAARRQLQADSCLALNLAGSDHTGREQAGHGHAGHGHAVYGDAVHDQAGDDHSGQDQAGDDQAGHDHAVYDPARDDPASHDQMVGAEAQSPPVSSESSA